LQGDDNKCSCLTATTPDPEQVGCSISEFCPLDALTCITAPTVNSYRGSGHRFWAPLFPMGYHNRTTALRVSAPDRFDYRSVTPRQPDLSFAAIIKAMDDAIKRNLDLHLLLHDAPSLRPDPPTSHDPHTTSSYAPPST